MKKNKTLSEFSCDFCGNNTTSRKNLPDGWRKQEVNQNTMDPDMHVCGPCLHSFTHAVFYETNFQYNIKKPKIGLLKVEYKEAIIKILVEDYEKFLDDQFGIK